MRLLADSHVVVWWLCTPKRLSSRSSDALSNSDNEVFYSAASVWEIELQMGRGRLQIPSTYLEALEDEGFTQLEVTATHARATARLPHYHRDPVDRMLIAQALEEGLMLITGDSQILDYDVPVLEA